MADVAISAAINKAVEIAGNFIVEERTRLYGLPDDVRWLEQQMRHMLTYLEDAEAKKVTNTQVKTLIDHIRDLAHDVEDILDIFLPQIEAHKSSGFLKRTINILPYGHTCRKFSKEIEKIKRRVKGIDEDRKTYGIEDINPSGADNNYVDPRTTTLHYDDPMIVGFDQDILELMTKLMDHQFVSIVGMPGVGKTTLAKKVFKEVKDDFECSASVSVSQDPNINGLLKDIATKVGLAKEKRDENLKSNLYSFLKEKRYVLLLDDIWHTEAWDRLRECFPIDSENGSRIIITSRYNDVGRYVGGECSLHQLNPFDGQTSWELFSKMIMPSLGITNEEFDRSAYKKIGKDIVEKCGGVPLAIEVTVGMLRKRGMSEFGWTQVLNSMGQDASDKCSQILGLSYMDLPAVLKPCFLYFGMFPEDYIFSAPQLIRIWMAEKLIQVIGVGEVKDVGEDYISQLDARNLIQVVKRGLDGRVKKFRVHDLLHSLCVNMGRDIDFLSTVGHSEASSTEKARRLAVFGDGALNYNMQKVRALFFFKFQRGYKDYPLENMLGMLKLLRVLIMETNSNILHLPNEVGNLSRLIYLHIESDNHVMIPVGIQKLKKLQMLYVRCTSVRIPVGILKMEQLTHLVLNVAEVEFHKFDDCLLKWGLGRVKISLPNIQTLILPRQLSEKLVPSALLKFTNLRKLVLNYVTLETMEVLLCGGEPISEKLETLHCYLGGKFWNKRVNLAKYGMLRDLEIYSVLSVKDVELPPSLIKLNLRGVGLRQDSLEALKKLPKLKFLELCYRSYIGSTMDLSGVNSFPQLEVLQLLDLNELEELIEGEEKGMPKLKQLIIEDCRRLVRIPEWLQQLRVSRWDSAALI